MKYSVLTKRFRTFNGIVELRFTRAFIFNKVVAGKKIYFYFLLLIAQAAIAQGTWTQKANFGGAARSYIPVGFSIGQYGYAGTGYDGSIYYSDLWKWNSTTNSWTQKANFGPGNRRYATALSINGKGYQGLGNLVSTNYSDWWEYDTTGNTWTQKANFPGTTRISPVSFVINGMAYVGGGALNTSSTSFYNDFYQYDPTNNTWTSKTGFAQLGRNAAVHFAVNGKGYMGTGYTGVWSADFWEYDPVGDTWTQKSNLPATGRTVAGAFVIGTKAYVGGGYNGSSDQSDLWEWDPAADVWVQKANIPTGGWSQMVSYSINGKGYFTLGRISGSPTAVNWQYDPGISTGLSESESNALVSVFPNPGKGHFKIRTGLESGEVTIFSLEGEVIFHSALADMKNKETDLSYLSTGVYPMTIRSEGKTVFRKLVIEK